MYYFYKKYNVSVGADIIRPHGGSPLQNSSNFLLDKSPEQMYYIRRAEVRSLKITTGEE